jgi:hypothetical protein
MKNSEVPVIRLRARTLSREVLPKAPRLADLFAGFDHSPLNQSAGSTGKFHPAGGTLPCENHEK